MNLGAGQNVTGTNTVADITRALCNSCRMTNIQSFIVKHFWATRLVILLWTQATETPFYLKSQLPTGLKMKALNWAYYST